MSIFRSCFFSLLSRCFSFGSFSGRLGSLQCFRLMADLTERFGHRFSYDRSWPVGLEMHHKDSGKGECVKILRQMFPQIHTIITAGDYENDLTMLREADIGCAVENAIPAVKEAADRIIVHCDEHAIAHIIHDLIPSLSENGNV